ncbi:MAG: cell wall-binding repeat-containing protein, partial [Erysipelotrichaceae bacterium]|nr:cell wall-binding repeat-containing protein [Erysipelotrichaceae bacterium]
NVIVSEHDYGKWVYDGPSAKTHTHVCSKDSSHIETQPCEFDEGVVAGNLIMYTCKVCGGTYTKDIDNPDDNGVIRIAGDNRFGTSQKIASAYKRLIGQEKVDAVILANGDVFADALAGSYLAAEKQAPIIITRAGKEAEINAYIRSILKEGGSIYILGGTAAVPEACLNGLVGRGYSISRLWGNNRYLTNLAILDSLGVQGDKVLVATGNNFADSLSASATGMPILLVRDDGLTEEQREFLSRNSGKEFIILGGTNAVNTQIEAQLTSYGTVRRIAGDNRAKTSIEIAKEFFPDARIAVTAYSHDFPDGLCGGPLANRLKAPLLLTRDRNADDTAAYMKSRNIKDGYVLGGPVRLTDSLIRKVFGLDASDKIIEFK